jgi:hypothetical protein
MTPPISYKIYWKYKLIFSMCQGGRIQQQQFQKQKTKKGAWQFIGGSCQGAKYTDRAVYFPPATPCYLIRAPFFEIANVIADFSRKRLR